MFGDVSCNNYTTFCYTTLINVGKNNHVCTLKIQPRKSHTTDCPNFPLCAAARTFDNILKKLDPLAKYKIHPWEGVMKKDKSHGWDIKNVGMGYHFFTKTIDHYHPPLTIIKD